MQWYGSDIMRVTSCRDIGTCYPLKYGHIHHSPLRVIVVVVASWNLLLMVFKLSTGPLVVV